MTKTRVCKICGEEKNLTDFYQCYVAGKTYYRRECKKCSLKRMAKYTRAHSQEKRKYLKKYYRENKERLRKDARQRRRERLAADPVYREKKRSSLLLWRAFNGNGDIALRTAIELIGCSPYEFTEHLKRTWEKEYGKEWKGEPCNIDHIVPLLTANTPQEVKKLCHFTNLRLITPEDNLAKGLHERKAHYGEWKKGLDNEA